MGGPMETPQKKKGRAPAAHRKNTQTNNTATDPLIGWHALAATAKKAQQKRLKGGKR